MTCGSTLAPKRTAAHARALGAADSLPSGCPSYHLAFCMIARVQALAVRLGDSLAVLVANLTPARLRCRIAALPARSVAVRRPDGESFGRSGTASFSHTRVAIPR
jgi:hypothetical protein